MTDADDRVTERIRDALSQRGAQARPEPDLEAVAHRAERSDSHRRRALTIALVVALILGPAAGFLVGRNVGGDSVDAAASGADASGSEPVAEDDSSSRDSGADGAEGSDDELASDTASDGASEPLGGAGDGAPAVSPELALTDPASVGTLDSREFIPPVTELVTIRETADGVAVRIYRQTFSPEEQYFDDQAPPWAPDWQPTGVCSPNGSLTVGFSTFAAVGQGWHETWSELTSSSLSGGAFGVEEGDPHWYVSVQVPPGVASVRALFSSGAVDEMAVVDGVAVLAGAAPVDQNLSYDDLWTPQGLVTTLDAGGNVVEEFPLGDDIWNAGYSPFDDDEFQARCQPPDPPPPPLPPAGEQPADVAAASAAVTVAIETVLNGSLEDTDRQPFLDDPTGAVAAARDEAIAGFGETVASARASVDETVFIAPDVAVVRYTLTVDLLGELSDRFAEVRFDGASWRVTAASVCSALSLAAVSCEGIEPYPQPDAYAPYHDSELEFGIATEDGFVTEDGGFAVESAPVP